MIDDELKHALIQLIDNQIVMMKKMGNIETELKTLNSILIKYDNDYQNQIAAENFNQ